MGTAGLQQSNADHFSNEAQKWDVKPHVRALAEAAADYLAQQHPLGPNTSVLEFGCGTGIISEKLAPHVKAVCGIDIAPGMIDAYNSKAAARGINNMKGLCLDITSKSDREQTVSKGDLPPKFDLIICHMTLHHVEDIGAVISSLAQLLASGGKLVLTDIFKTDTSHLFHGSHVHHTVSHEGGFSEETIKQLVQAASLRLKRFNTTALHISKVIPLLEGGETEQSFPIFVALAAKDEQQQ